MAYIEEKPNGKYRAQIRTGGISKSKTFDNKADALIWAKTTERAITNKTVVSSKMLFRELCDEYEIKVSKHKKSARWEAIRLNQWRNDPMLGDKPINLITTQLLREWLREKLSRTYRGNHVKTSTVARELSIMKSMFSNAVDWELLEKSPAERVNVKVVEGHRERVATEEEIEKLKAQVEWEEDEPPYEIQQRVIAAFIVACNTGLRISEIVRMEKTWLSDHCINIPTKTKTGYGRKVAVRQRAWDIINLVMNMELGPRFWGLEMGQHDPTFRKIRNACGLGPVRDSDGYLVQEGLNFHDSRATFCTWAASPGPDGAPRLDVLALARQTGHKNLKQLMTYYRKDAMQMLERLED